MSEVFLRQLGLVNQKALNKLGVTVVGCGSIGSFTAITLSKLGVGELALFDNHNVKLHNVSNQFFGLNYLGCNKAEVTKELCCLYGANNERILVYPFKFKDHQIKTEVVLASVDNIESRERIFEQAVKSDKCKLYIDVRMLADNLKVFTVNLTENKHIEQFKEDFLTDIKNQQARCTERTVIYNVLMCASLICNLIKKHVNSETLPYHVAYGFKDNIQIVDKEVFKNAL